MKVSIYADGSSCGRVQAACGWGWVVMIDDKILTGGCDGLAYGTNNVAELRGAIDGIKAFLTHPDGGLQIASPLRREALEIELVSDSQYTLGMANGSFSPVKNLELAQELRKLCLDWRITTRWVRGHAGDPANEMCDRLAKEGRMRHTDPTVLEAKAAKKRKKNARADRTDERPAEGDERQGEHD